MFKLKEVELKDGKVRVYFEGSLAIMLHLLPDIDGLTYTVGSIVKSMGLSDKMVKACDSMLMNEDPSLFKDILGAYHHCGSLEEYTERILCNLPSGILESELELFFNRVDTPEVIQAFEQLVDFHTELNNRLSNL